MFETPEGKIHPGLFAELAERVQQLVPELDAFYIDQFNNEHHPEGYRSLGAEIVADCPDITDLVMGVGTGGSVVGATAGIQDERDDVPSPSSNPRNPPSSRRARPARTQSRATPAHAYGTICPFVHTFPDEDAYDEWTAGIDGATMSLSLPTALGLAKAMVRA